MGAICCHKTLYYYFNKPGELGSQDPELMTVAAATAAAKSLQSCPTLCDPMDCSPPGSSAHGVFQARALEWGAIAFSVRGPYLPLSKSRLICSHVFSEDSLALDSLGCILGIVC